MLTSVTPIVSGLG